MKSRTLFTNEKATTEDAKMEFATSKYELHQIINELIHVIENPLFCTDLVFTSQPNLVVDSSVHPSLHPNYDHQIQLTRNVAYGQTNTKFIGTLVHEFSW